MRAPWGNIPPRLTEISDAVLCNHVWHRPGLSARDRSSITVASLISLYRTNTLPFHLGKASGNGATRDEIIEMVTHPAFHAGWPIAGTAISNVRQAFEKAGAGAAQAD